MRRYLSRMRMTSGPTNRTRFTLFQSLCQQPSLCVKKQPLLIQVILLQNISVFCCPLICSLQPAQFFFLPALLPAGSFPAVPVFPSSFQAEMLSGFWQADSFPLYQDVLLLFLPVPAHPKVTSFCCVSCSSIPLFRYRATSRFSSSYCCFRRLYCSCSSARTGTCSTRLSAFHPQCFRIFLWHSSVLVSCIAQFSTSFCSSFVSSFPFAQNLRDVFLRSRHSFFCLSDSLKQKLSAIQCFFLLLLPDQLFLQISCLFCFLPFLLP